MIHPNPPDKIAGLLKIARDSGLTVKRGDDYATCVTWVITSPNPVDDTQIWIAWNPGPNGGRVTRTVYYGPGSIMRKATRNWVRIVLVEMGDSLQRHQQSEAAKAAIETPELEPCGCPTQIVRDEGHQEGCQKAAAVTPEQARAALAQVGRELNANAAGIRAALAAADEQLTTFPQPPAIDPTRPGWFEVGQVIMERGTDLTFNVLDLERYPDGRTKAVLVSVNGGYGVIQWYGDHFQAAAGLDFLEGPHIGRPENTMRAWPKSVYPAIEAVRHTLTDQCLRGYVLANPSGPGVVVNLPRDTEPERHMVLLRRYLPYPAHVNLHQVSPPSEGRYYTLLVTPKN